MLAVMCLKKRPVFGQCKVEKSIDQFLFSIMEQILIEQATFVGRLSHSLEHPRFRELYANTLFDEIEGGKASLTLRETQDFD